jgi:DNA (cytosine-5)-methyltransferase 1
MSLGLEESGFKVVYANEINKNAAATYRRNFPRTLLEAKDVRKVRARALFKMLGEPMIDVLAAGVPCQGFSSAGKRQAADPRNLLYKEVLRFAKAFRPSIVVLENVAGMLAERNRPIAKEILHNLRRIGYHPHLKVLVASRFGVPQRRRRVFIIATSSPIPKSKVFPRSSGKSVNVSAAISDLAFLQPGDSSSEFRTSQRSAYQRLINEGWPLLYNHESPRHSKGIQKRFRSIRRGSRHPRQNPTKKQTHLRLNPRRLANTITSIPEDSIHYRRDRGLTVREMARLQSFPDWFEFKGPRGTGGERRAFEIPQYTQVANAVPPLLAQAVFKNLHLVLDEFYPVDPDISFPLVAEMAVARTS